MSVRHCIPTYYLTNYVLTKHKDGIIVIKSIKSLDQGIMWVV